MRVNQNSEQISELDKNAYSDVLNYVSDWVKTENRSITMLAQLICVAAMHFDGPYAGTILSESIKKNMEGVAN